MSFDREQVAKAYQTALRVTRAQFFEADASLPVSLTDSAHTPYLGWVGKNYRGGTVLPRIQEEVATARLKPLPWTRV